KLVTGVQTCALPILVAGLSVVANVLSCSLAAYAFARLRFKFQGALFAFMIATLMLPYHVTLIPQYVIFQQAGLVNTFVPLILPRSEERRVGKECGER